MAGIPEAAPDWAKGLPAPTMANKAEGTKHDNGKPQLSLVPREALDEIAKVLTYGAKKYGKGNYKAGFDRSRLLDAALRHLTSYCNKEDKDSESDLSHLAHAAATLCMLMQNIATGVGKDDR